MSSARVLEVVCSVGSGKYSVAHPTSPRGSAVYRSFPRLSPISSSSAPSLLGPADIKNTSSSRSSQAVHPLPPRTPPAAEKFIKFYELPQVTSAYKPHKGRKSSKASCTLLASGSKWMSFRGGCLFWPFVLFWSTSVVILLFSLWQVPAWFPCTRLCTTPGQDVHLHATHGHYTSDRQAQYIDPHRYW